MKQANIPKILLIGAGGLACGFTIALRRALLVDYEGPEFLIHILDGDIIECSNLNRQILFTEDDLGQAKAEVLATRLIEDLPEPPPIQVMASREFFTIENANTLLSDASYVIDATDSTSSKFLINDCCVSRKIPFCYAGASVYSGQVLAVKPFESGCLRCLFGDLQEHETTEQERTCQQSGILGPVAGLMGVLQAGELLKHLHSLNASQSQSETAASAAEKHITPSVTNKLHRFSASPRHLASLSIAVAEDCPIGCASLFTESVDLREIRCPETFLYAKLALEQLDSQQVLQILFSTIEDASRVSASLVEEGHQVVGRMVRIGEDSWSLLLRKASEAKGS